ncbi:MULTISPECIES: CCA tRNA nucleotidyltransferase [Chlamydia]|uniref:CCA tRNA nucleotidyltransferase n=1 Tax=Chlamydophila parapsittaci TaxID=344886 RepID=A0ABX5VXD8_9CHLA|nr:MULTISPECIES: CCA tRNA nucleotidyltransferase [Chlamydia]EPJ32301.1 poly A polymerase head domain protein [Chlamydia psittaci 06-1683]EPP31079.1 poly A polymerase head domain protein [Chlamydia psittaci C1/97]AFS21054.1 poly A polymerase head domain protein [Chlamydia psittaci GR9]AFS23955.1 poly A polymerase head domain protein [Chlamydia psittaci WS/RT/E30]EPP29797.1 poly A polymerase head domain protein [Chlamydia psittaci 08-2626_L3]
MTTIALEAAKKILLKLRNAGYQAYFVGGCVRDMLMGKPIEEIDIATSAPPVIVSTIFPDTLALGAAFGIIVVKENNRLFEVATFRSDENYQDGRHPERVIFSSMKEDALRRDFTINGMYYDPFEEKLFDLVEGRRDLEKRVIRAIGHPKLRFSEDKLRILRAIRFSSSLGFTLDPATERAIIKEAPSLVCSLSPERIWQELKKMLKKNPYEALSLLIRLKIITVIFPELRDIPPSLLRTSIEFAKRLNPLDFPEICFLLPLFQGVSEEAACVAFTRLRVSNKDLKLIQLWYQALPQFQNVSNNRVFWAHFLASPTANLFLSLFSATQKDPSKQQNFIARVQELEERLEQFIVRIKTASPLVSAPDLISRGIAPGRLLGDLLKEAETLSIENECHDKEKILTLLKEKGFWK